MPKIANQHINAEANDGTKFQGEYACHVTSDGLFTIELDPRLGEAAYEMLDVEITPDFKPFKIWRHAVGLVRTYEKERVNCKELNMGLRFIKACAEAFISGKETTERVIVYNSKLDVAFWKINDLIVPNGRTAPQSGGSWWKAKTTRGMMHSAESRTAFAIGIGAAVYDKITTERITGKTIRWERTNLDDESWCCRLNSFFGLSVDPELPDAMEMRYTPDAAEFFCKIMLELCKMAESLDNFLADKSRVKKAIETKNQKLIGW